MRRAIWSPPCHARSCYNPALPSPIHKTGANPLSRAAASAIRVRPANSHVSALSLTYSMAEDLRRDIATPVVASTQPPLLLFLSLGDAKHTAYPIFGLSKPSGRAARLHGACVTMVQSAISSGWPGSHPLMQQVRLCVDRLRFGELRSNRCANGKRR